MSDLFIFDGYNLMHALEPGGITAGNLEEKRAALVELVVNYLATTGDRAFIVFDSSGGEAAPCNKITGTPVTVCYASAKENADILIGKLVQQELQNQEKKDDSCIRVVSADWEVQRGAMQERVERIPPRRLIAELKKK
jgi:predicted RNA-binding protein with PIN domain